MAARVLESRWEGPLSGLPFRDQLLGLDLRLLYGGEGALARSGTDFCWTLSEAEASDFVERLRVLAASASPGHAYLDTALGNGRVQVIASIGEYNPQRIFVD